MPPTTVQHPYLFLIHFLDPIPLHQYPDVVFILKVARASETFIPQGVIEPDWRNYDLQVIGGL